MGRIDHGEDQQTTERLDTTLVKGLRILEALAFSNEPLGVSTLSETLGIGRSNTHRLLKTLSATGYVSQEPGTRRYLPTLKTWEQGSLVVERSRLRRAAQPILRRLHEETGEVVFLSVLHGGEILYVLKIDPVDNLATTARAGQRVPAIFTASGKVLLAYQPDAEGLINEIAARVPSFDPQRKALLIKEMEEIRADGFAYSSSGWTAHANSTAVAVPNANLPPVVSIGLATLGPEAPRRQQRRFISVLQRSAAELGALVAPLLDPT